MDGYSIEAADVGAHHNKSSGKKGASMKSGFTLQRIYSGLNF